MADGGAGNDVPGFDYGSLVRSALLDVVRQVLARTADDGLPGDHELYLTFGTTETGVELPSRLLKQFPDEMTIVLQHQFWNLTVDANGFAVTLRFGGTPERLGVPWAALRSFADPSVGFGLRLRPENEPEGDERPAGDAVAGAAAATGAAAPAGPTAGSGKVLELGAFRRRMAEPKDE